MALAQSNATLREVHGQGGVVEDMGTPLSPGAPKWTGDARIYYVEEVRRFPSDRGLEMVTTRSITCDADHPNITFERGDILKFDLDGGPVDQEGTVQERARYKIPAVPGETHIALEDG